MERLNVPFESKYLEVIVNEPTNAAATILLAHGAGAGMDHFFMHYVANALLERHIRVVRYNFPYITEGKKFTGSPNRNIAAWAAIVEWALPQFQSPLYLAGKSYGGRMASHLAANHPEKPIAGLIYIGFPLHAPGKPSIDRANHLAQIRIPQLFLQGTNDALAEIHLISSVVKNTQNGRLVEVPEADHSFKVKGKKHETAIQQLAEDVLTWLPLKKNTLN